MGDAFKQKLYYNIGRKKMAKLYIKQSVTLGHINPEVQGHFSEHLGRCIYEGIYVG